MRSFVAAILTFLAILPIVAPAAPWYSPIPVTAGATIHASVQGGGQVVFVGGAGLVATSTDRKTWTRRTSGTTATLFGVAYGAGRYVAVGEQGKIISSANGSSWVTERGPQYTSGLAPDINGITFANGRFVAASRSMNGSSMSENIMTSPDGRTWTQQTVDRAGFQMQFVTFANGLYVAGGGGILMVSPDATTWRTVWTGQSWLYAGVRGDARWVVSGSDGVMLSSADGATWTETQLGQRATAFGLGYRNGRFLAVGLNSFTIPGNTASVFSSADGLLWTALPFPETAAITRRDFLRSLLVTDSGFLAFGNGGLMAESTDGAAWNLLSQPADRPHFNDVVYANGRFVAVGDKGTNLEISGINQGRIGAIYTSTDGWNWQEQTSGVRGSILRNVAFGNGRFVAVGTAAVVYSEDGLTWRQATHPAIAPFSGIAYGAGRFVVVSGRGLMTSSDGVTWEAQTATGATSYSGIRFANGSFFASTSPFRGPVHRSFDGFAWTSIALVNSSSLSDLAFHEGLWVAATAGGGEIIFEGNAMVSRGSLQVSTDGTVWTGVRSPYFGGVNTVQRLPDRWVAGSPEGAVFSSIDGRTWALEERPTNNGIARIVAGPDYAVAVGSSGMLLTTRDPQTVPVLQTVMLGQPFQLTATVVGTPMPALQWLKDSVAIPGATSLIYSVAAASEGDAGTYTVRATGFGGTVPGAGFRVSVVGSRIVNLSVLAGISAATPELSVGFVVSGDAKPLLVRAVGPALAQFGVSPVLPRPGMNLYAGQTPLVANDGWDRGTEGPAVAAAAVRVGAFGLAAASNDAAVLHAFAHGNQSAVIRSRAAAEAGKVLVEIYDADATTRARLVNVSTLAAVGTGDDILVAGFVLRGNAKRRVLIRAIGPGLSGFGRTGVLVDPQLAVTPAGAQAAIAVNDNWGGGVALSSAFREVAAFALAADSKDAAVELSLEPGGYTVQVSGVGRTVGDALLEVYELP